MTSLDLHLDVRPVTGRIGAEISGIDLSSTLDDDTVAQIRRALLAHRVVFFRDQDLDTDGLVAFGERFGPVTNGHPTIPGPEYNPVVQEIQYPPGGARQQLAQRRQLRRAPALRLDPAGPRGAAVRR